MTAPRVLALLTETFTNGGIQRFNRTLLTACGQIGVRCDVLSLNDVAASVPPDATGMSGNVWTFGRSKLRFSLASVRALLTGRYDWVIVGHINMLPLIAAVRAVAGGRCGRLVLVAHGAEVWERLRGARRRALRRSSLLLCVSRYTRDRILAQVPELSPGKCMIFPNALGRSWTDGAVAPSRGTLSEESQPRRFILSVARLDRADRTKGIVAVLEALPMLRDRTIHYVIAGTGDDLQFLRDVAARNLVDDRVYFVGSVADAELAQLYRQCLAFVLPSSQEGFGIVFIEAMLFGVPVVAAREKGAVDALMDGETGLLVDYGDVAALASAIDAVTGNEQLRVALCRRALDTVTGNGRFTFQAFVGRCSSIFGTEGS
jgi:phosphatidylinositol alpha-1,6-mannosyltransferase